MSFKPAISLLLSLMLLSACQAENQTTFAKKIKNRGWRLRAVLKDEDSRALRASIDLANKSLSVSTEYQLALATPANMASSSDTNVIPVVVLSSFKAPKLDLFIDSDLRAIFINWDAFQQAYQSEEKYFSSHKDDYLKSQKQVIDFLRRRKATGQEIPSVDLDESEAMLQEFSQTKLSRVTLLFVGLLHELGHIHYKHDGLAGQGGLLFHSEKHLLAKGLEGLNAAISQDKDNETEADTFVAEILVSATADQQISNSVADAMNPLYLLGGIEAKNIAAKFQGNNFMLFDTDYQHECRTMRLYRIHSGVLQRIVDRKLLPEKRKQHEMQIKQLGDAMGKVEENRYERFRAKVK